MQDMPEQDSPETVLAFDFGLRRIGVAVGQDVTGTANPLGIVMNGETGPDFDRIDVLVAEWRPNRIIVGMPTLADGTPGELEKDIKAFIADLGRYELPLDTEDERYSSIEAESALKDARKSGSRGRIRKEDIDAAAAVMIAERFLSRNR